MSERTAVELEFPRMSEFNSAMIFFGFAHSTSLQSVPNRAMYISRKDF